MIRVLAEVAKNIRNAVGQRIMGNSIAVAISGGIDSFYVLKEALLNYEDITAAYLNFLNNKEQLRKVKLISEYFNVPLKVYDCIHEFKRNVIDYFADEYLQGRTPNPCAICNEKFKFKFLLNYYDKIVTGHYAKIISINGKYFISKGSDLSKEQSYFLARMPIDLLGRVIFILGDKTKDFVKKKIFDEYVKFGIFKESQEICFIPDNNYKNFLEKQMGIKENSGLIISSSGKILGKHSGFYNFTIGQRKGLNIAMGEPYYVTSIDAKKNIVYAGSKEETFNKGFEIDNILWYDLPEKYEKLKVKVRYRTTEKLCDINGSKVFFLEKEQSVTPGQLAVFYYKNIVLGSGWINAVL
jgi:tRNA-specific 2-thiouridylase